MSTERTQATSRCRAQKAVQTNQNWQAQPRPARPRLPLLDRIDPDCLAVWQQATETEKESMQCGQAPGNASGSTKTESDAATNADQQRGTRRKNPRTTQRRQWINQCTRPLQAFPLTSQHERRPETSRQIQGLPAKLPRVPLCSDTSVSEHQRQREKAAGCAIRSPGVCKASQCGGASGGELRLGYIAGPERVVGSEARRVPRQNSVP